MSSLYMFYSLTNGVGGGRWEGGREGGEEGGRDVWMAGWMESMCNQVCRSSVTEQEHTEATVHGLTIVTMTD